MESNRGKELFAILLFVLLTVVLLSPFISYSEVLSNLNLPSFSSDNQATGAVTFETSKSSLRGLLTNIPPSYIVMSFVTIGIILSVAEIQTRNKKN